MKSPKTWQHNTLPINPQVQGKVSKETLINKYRTEWKWKYNVPQYVEFN